MIFNLKTQNQGQKCMFHTVFYIAKVNTINAVKMCKTKCIVYFTAIRSSVSKLLEKNSIIDPFSMCESYHLGFKKYKYVAETILICSLT